MFPVVKDLILIPVHTKPEDSLKELDELYDVVEAVRSNWGSDVSLIDQKRKGQNEYIITHLNNT